MSALAQRGPSEAPHTLVPPAAVSRALVAKRAPFAFGPRFFLGLLLGLLWLGPAWWDRRFLFGMLIWDVFVLLLWAWDARRLPQPEQLEVRRRWTAAVALSTRASVEVEVVNHGKVAVLVEGTDDLPPTLVSEPPGFTLAARAGSTGTASYWILPGVRGDAALGGIFIRYQSPLRLAERWARAETTQTVRVYPNLEEAKRHTIYLIRSRQVEVEKRLQRRRGQGREFESLREYREGDEHRDICWTATARRSVPITKVYQVERSQAVWICLDAGRLLRAREGGLSKLDCAVNAALSLAHVALYSGDRVGLIAYGRQIQQRLNAARGTPHLRALVDRLALVRSDPFEADHGRAAQLLLTVQKQRSLVVWLTDLAETATTPEVIEHALQLTSRHLVLFVVIGEPELTRVATQRPENIEEMYRSVAAVEMVQRRDLLLGRLRQRGALAVEHAARELATPLVNHYLDIKERSLL